MFGFLKEKLKSWLGKSKKDVEETAEKKEKKIKVKEEKPKKQEEKPKKPEKKEKRKKTAQEISQEREITQEVMNDMQKEGLDIKSPEEKTEEMISALEEDQEIKEKEPEEIIEEKPKEEKKLGFFERLRKVFSYSLTKDKFDDIFSDLEMLLLESNVALEVVEKIKENLGKELIGKELKKEKIQDEIQSALKKAVEDILIEPEDTIKRIKEYKKSGKEPFVILFFGINGAGKTTSIAKFTDLCLKNKLSCVMAAADTFRAASIEQISIHAERLKVKVIKHDYGSDPSAVAFDAIKYAKSNDIDVVLIDTAGRMHTKENLLHEMEKICRVTKPTLKVFVAEAVAGNDATEQARAFNEMIGIDGSILSKTDVDEKGGTIISISYVTKKPILYLGVGQEYKDLELFDKEKFIKRLGL